MKLIKAILAVVCALVGLQSLAAKLDFSNDIAKAAGPTEMDGGNMDTGRGSGGL